jgi:quercetin dioxygenase-like cupin family protein
MLVSTATRGAAQDPATAAPQNYTVLFENDRVRVLEHRSRPGEKVPMHSHQAHLGYVLSAGKVKFTFPDGQTTEVDAKAGEVLWLDPVSHAAENVGTTELRVLVVELKK